MSIKPDYSDTETMTRQQYLALATETPVPFPTVDRQAADQLTKVVTAVAGQAWRARANCRDIVTDEMCPGRGEATKPAKEICAGCTVRAECLDYGLHEHFGIWGGMSERERRRERRLRARRRAADRQALAS